MNLAFLQPLKPEGQSKVIPPIRFIFVNVKFLLLKTFPDNAGRLILEKNIKGGKKES